MPRGFGHTEMQAAKAKTPAVATSEEDAGKVPAPAEERGMEGGQLPLTSARDGGADRPSKDQERQARGQRQLPPGGLEKGMRDHDDRCPTTERLFRRPR